MKLTGLLCCYVLLEAKDLEQEAKTMEAEDGEEKETIAELDKEQEIEVVTEISSTDKHDESVSDEEAKGENARKTFNKKAQKSKDLKSIPGYPLIHGSLRITDSEIGQLTISRKSFSEEKTVEGKDRPELSREDDSNPMLNGMVLDSAKIGQLEIHKASPKENHEASSIFPYPISYASLEVSSWNFVCEKSNNVIDEVELAECYTGFLENGELYRDVYRDVYQQLRNVGEFKAAIDVFVAEHERAYKKWRIFRRSKFNFHEKILNSSFAKGVKSVVANDRFGIFRWIGKAVGLCVKPFALIGKAIVAIFNFITDILSLIWRWVFYKPVFAGFMRYGAEPTMLVWIIVGLMLSSNILVSSEHRNFELSDGARMVLASAQGGTSESRAAAIGIDFKPDDEVVGPGEDNWQSAEALWMTIRYHVPIIAVLARSDYEPTDDRGIIINGMDEPIVDWFTPEDWFMFMALVNWALLPILLTFWLNKALRSGEL